MAVQGVPTLTDSPLQTSLFKLQPNSWFSQSVRRHLEFCPATQALDRSFKYCLSSVHCHRWRWRGDGWPPMPQRPLVGCAARGPIRCCQESASAPVQSNPISSSSCMRFGLRYRARLAILCTLHLRTCRTRSFASLCSEHRLSKPMTFLHSKALCTFHVNLASALALNPP